MKWLDPDTDEYGRIVNITLAVLWTLFIGLAVTVGIAG